MVVELQTMSHESSGLCWCGPNNHGPETSPAVVGWAGQAMRLPAWWYERINEGSRAEFPVSGDATAKARANPPMFFAETGIAHGSRPLPLRA